MDDITKMIENDEMKLFIEKLNSDLSNCPNDYSKNNFLEMINH